MSSRHAIAMGLIFCYNSIAVMIKKIYNHFMTDSLYQNSIYLMASTFVMAVLGFFFWIICARLFNPEKIGLATTLISITALISSFSLLGLNAGLIRYLPTSKQINAKINTSFTLVIITSVILGIVYLLGIQSFSPKLAFIKGNLLFSSLFILIMVFVSLNTIIESIFIAYRSSKYVLFKNVVLSIIKILLPFLLISFGAYGIFMSFGLSLAIACLVSFVFLITKFHYVFKPMVNNEAIKRMMKFSFGNYLSGFINLLPMNILPIIITNKIGPSTSAYFYMGMMIANLLYIIPIAASQSLFAEGSHSEDEIRISLKKAGLIIFYLMLPAIVLTIVFGKYILLAFGSQYSAEGSTFLSLVAIAGIFVSLNQVGNALLNVRHKVQYNIVLNSLIVAIIISLSYVLISSKLVGVGIAWIIGQAAISIVYLFLIKKYL
jgi:O-antigen/teichoic acid export membrane protein